MNEKQAVADTLSSTNAIINMLTYSVMQSNNKNLRDTFQNARDQMEALQWEIYLIAKQNGYYTPAAPGDGHCVIYFIFILLSDIFIFGANLLQISLIISLSPLVILGPITISISSKASSLNLTS